MIAKRDFSSEIGGLIVLTILSAMSHFWLIMIAICAGTIVGVAGYLISSIVLHASRDMLERLLSPAGHNHASRESEAPVGPAGQSLPVA